VPATLKLSLRDLFWLVLVCALAVGWWADRSRLRHEFWGLACQLIDEVTKETTGD
jgi:hypothetical protein